MVLASAWGGMTPVFGDGISSSLIVASNAKICF
jgi:hypothetical protein